MPRIAFFEKNEPVQVGDKYICQCGLSDNFPFCSGNHKMTADEDKMKVYQYVDGERVVVGELHNHEHGGCGCGNSEGGCCKDKEEGDDEDHGCGCGHDHHHE